MKTLPAIRRLLAATAILSLALFAWGCGDALPTGPDAGGVEYTPQGNEYPELN